MIIKKLETYRERREEVGHVSWAVTRNELEMHARLTRPAALVHGSPRIRLLGQLTELMRR